MSAVAMLYTGGPKK